MDPRTVDSVLQDTPDAVVHRNVTGFKSDELGGHISAATKYIAIRRPCIISTLRHHNQFVYDDDDDTCSI